ncbi:MAG: circadian clock KaiB family protein [Arenicellales bacterium]
MFIRLAFAVAAVGAKRIVLDTMETFFSTLPDTAKPQRARKDQIIAVPTLVRARPEPMRRIVGDLSNTQQVLLGLELPANPTVPRQAE